MKNLKAAAASSDLIETDILLAPAGAVAELSTLVLVANVENAESKNVFGIQLSSLKL